MNTLALGDQVRDVLEHEGISEAAVMVMLERAAITSLSGANRRFHSWLFQVQASGLVEKMFKYNPELGNGVPLIPHKDCFGWGCQFCGWGGFIAKI